MMQSKDMHHIRSLLSLFSIVLEKCFTTIIIIVHITLSRGLVQHLPVKTGFDNKHSMCKSQRGETLWGNVIQLLFSNKGHNKYIGFLNN